MKKINRIRKDQQFKEIISKKQSLVTPCYIIYYQPKQYNYCRIGISVSKKLGHAVVRNKIKRQIRNMIEQTMNYYDYPYDIIIIVRKVYLLHDFAYNKNALSNTLNKAKIK